MKNKKKRNIVKFPVKKSEAEEKLASVKQRILINVGAVLIAVVLISVIMVIIGHIHYKSIGFEDREELIQYYFTALNNADKMDMERCFYPYRKQSDENVEQQMSYVQNEKENNNIEWEPEEIQIEWEDADTDRIKEIMSDITVEDSARCIAFVPLTQKTADGTVVEEKDVYEFFIHKTNGLWYVAAYMQNARNITGAVRANGTRMTDDEVSEWIYSFAKEIGSDIVGYLYVDGYWSEITDEDNQDDHIKTFITSDYSSYMTMALIKDSDVEDFTKYSESIIKQSSNGYGGIMTSDGLIGEYKTDVQIAQNEETGARIIIWVFKTDPESEYTHVITLEALSDYDASTYINTFHLEKEKEDETSETETETK